MINLDIYEELLKTNPSLAQTYFEGYSQPQKLPTHKTPSLLKLDTIEILAKKFRCSIEEVTENFDFLVCLGILEKYKIKGKIYYAVNEDADNIMDIVNDHINIGENFIIESMSENSTIQ